MRQSSGVYTCQCVCISNVIDVIGNFSIPVKGQQKKNEKGGSKVEEERNMGMSKLKMLPWLLL